VGFTEKDDIFDAFHPADRGDNAEEQYIDQIMLFTAVDPGVRDMGEFGSYVHVSPPFRPYRLFSPFLEGVYNAVAPNSAAGAIDKSGAPMYIYSGIFQRK
jgi:hypothetical protein